RITSPRTSPSRNPYTGSTLGSLQPRVLAAVRVFATRLRCQSKVGPRKLQDVARCFARQDSLDDVAMRRVALGLALKQPLARLGTEHVAPVREIERGGRVVERRPAAQHDLTQIAEANGRQAMCRPLDVRVGAPPALGDLVPDWIDQVPVFR